jgi:hypothetical protein
MLEIGLHSLRAVDQELHEVCGLLQQSVEHPAAVGAAHLRLEVPVELFIRVALQRVGRQVEHLDLLLMFLRTGSHLLGIVRTEIVKHQEHFVPFAVLHEPLHEADCCLGSRSACEELKPHQGLAADGRDHRQSKVLARSCQHRRISRRGITSDPMPLLRHRLLVGPVDDAVILLGFQRNQGVDHLHPALHVPGLLLQRLASGTLRYVAPALQVFAHRAAGQVNAKLCLDEIAHGATIPQGKQQAPCRWRLRGQDRSQHPFQRQRQGAARQVGAIGFLVTRPGSPSVA